MTDLPMSATDDSLDDSKALITVEVCLSPNSTAAPSDIRPAVEQYLSTKSLRYQEGPIALPSAQEDPYLGKHVSSLTISDIDQQTNAAGFALGSMLLFWQVQLNLVVYQLNEEDVAEDDEGEDNVASYSLLQQLHTWEHIACSEWQLPSTHFHGLWESLVFDTEIKIRLLHYASSALLFADKRVNNQLISWNRVVLLHGPPGTGKTSLCKALAQKLCIHFGGRYAQGQLIEVNAHSLFSKWFSESGKLVSRLFAKIQEMVDEEDSLVFVLIDEVESLTSARKAAVSGSEPVDAVRAVNALLTQLDSLKAYANVMVLTTSNITEAIDLAFVDRADIKAYIGPPPLHARYEILRTCVSELQRVGIITDAVSLVRYDEICGDRRASSCMDEHEAMQQVVSRALVQAAAATEGFSGRALRKLPFLAHATSASIGNRCSSLQFIAALEKAALRESQDRVNLQAVAPTELCTSSNGNGHIL